MAERPQARAGEIGGEQFPVFHPHRQSQRKLGEAPRMAEGSGVSIFQRTSFRILAGGTLLFVLLDALARQADNRGYIPLVIIVGAFVVPVAFVSYIYEREPGRDIPVRSVTLCFLWGGALGVSVAAILEYATVQGLGPGQLLGVGVIEESAKLIFPLVIYFRGRYCSEADGVIFGVAAGMGFAAFETIGYGAAAAQSSGGIGSAEATLIVRGLISPAGHGAWTGLVCAYLWRERENVGRRILDLPLAGAFSAAVILHTLWDVFNTQTEPSVLEAAGIEIGSGIIALLGLALLFHMVNEAARRRPLYVPGCSP
ncbi:MAG: PrsW family intramembrane metalloprotease [Dehalococcoidia bacterium]|jgi:RsiW-degrading membrane proteinase PrsW (M82 family)